MRNVIILISGGGSNMAAIVRAAQTDHWADRLGARVAAVISNRPDACGLEFARAQGIATRVADHTLYPDRAAFDDALMQSIAPFDPPQHGSSQSDPHHPPALVLLAGFMRILTEGFVRRFSGRLLNIHPSLLPAFAGLHTHQRALDAGCKQAGATVHLVTPELDQGPILAQAAVPILPGDTAQTLAARVLSQEHLIYPRAVAQWLRDHRDTPLTDV